MTSIAGSPTDAMAKILALFSTRHLPRFGTRRLPSRLILMRGVVLFQHGHGCGSQPCSPLAAVTYLP